MFTTSLDVIENWTPPPEAVETVGSDALVEGETTHCGG